MCDVCMCVVWYVCVVCVCALLGAYGSVNVNI